MACSVSPIHPTLDQNVGINACPQGSQSDIPDSVAGVVATTPASVDAVAALAPTTADVDVNASGGVSSLSVTAPNISVSGLPAGVSVEADEVNTEGGLGAPAAGVDVGALASTLEGNEITMPPMPAVSADFGEGQVIKEEGGDGDVAIGSADLTSKFSAALGAALDSQENESVVPAGKGLVPEGTAPAEGVCVSYLCLAPF